MILSWYGLGCVKIETGGIVIVLNPFYRKPEWGVQRAPGFWADIVLISQENELCNNTQGLDGQAFVISGAGEYEIKDIIIQGIENIRYQDKGSAQNIIYAIKVEEIRIAHLGMFQDKRLSEEAFEILSDIDLLIMPVGGGMVMNASVAASIAAKVEPRIIIPVFFKTHGLSLKLDPVQNFVKEINLSPVQKAKLNIKKKDLTDKETKLVVLESQLN